MPDPAPPRSPAGAPPGPGPTPFEWPADVGRVTALVVAEYRAEAIRRWGVHATPAVVRRMAMRFGLAVVASATPLPCWRAALAKIHDGLLHREPPVERYRMALACHPGDWTDPGTRLAFLAEFARSVDASPEG